MFWEEFHVLVEISIQHKWIYVSKIQNGLPEVARLWFCTCPCDILYGVSMYIAYSVRTVIQHPLPRR